MVSLAWPTLRPVTWPAVFVFLALCGRTLIGGLPDYDRVYDTRNAQIGITSVTMHAGVLCVPSDTQIQDKANSRKSRVRMHSSLGVSRLLFRTSVSLACKLRLCMC